MNQWYYQIKAKQEGGDSCFGNWIWPPVFSGMVEAETKKQAREQIDQEYGQKFPMRVLSKDIDSASFLLKITKLNPENGKIHSLFLNRECPVCGSGYRVIDHYNNDYQVYKGFDFCSDECKEMQRQKDKAEKFFSANIGKHPPVIYQITNRENGKCYIGQTTQAFTLRWWQHFFHGCETKFHKAIKDSRLEDWDFKVIEVIEVREIKGDVSLPQYISEREQYWINHFNSIDEGYNTAIAQKTDNTATLFDEGEL